MSPADWEDLQAWDGRPVNQPSLFLAGAEDASVGWLGPAIAARATTLPGPVASHPVPRAGHRVRQERPDELNASLLGLPERGALPATAMSLTRG